MKIISYLFLFVLLSSFVVAMDVQSEFYADTFSSGEAVAVRLNFDSELYADLQATDFSVQGENGKLSITKRLDMIDANNYYFSFILPQVPDGGYEVFIKDLRYIEEGKLRESSFAIPFTIENRDAVLQVWPPVWYGIYDDAFNPQTQLEVKNKGTNLVTASLSDEGGLVTFFSPATVKLIPENLNWIYLKTGVTDFTKPYHTSKVSFEYGDQVFYLPVVLKKKFTAQAFNEPWDAEVENVTVTNVTNVNVTEVNVTETNVTELNVTNETQGNPSLIITYPFEDNLQVSLVKGDLSTPLQLIFKNTGDVNLNNVSLTLTEKLSDIILFSESSLVVLPVGESYTLEGEIDSTLANYSFYGGDIVVSSAEGASDKLGISIQIVMTQEEQDVVLNVSSNLQDTNSSLPQNLERDYSSWIVLIFVVLVLLFIGVVIYKKGKKKREDFDEYIDKIKRK